MHSNFEYLHFGDKNKNMLEIKNFNKIMMVLVMNIG